MSAAADPFIDPMVRVRIEAELDAIERAHGVRILIAAESGSRAWRFPSQDSDYDVRFIYVQPIEGYLTVLPRRDVIERPIDATLDVNGWDLLKALKLLLRSNAVLLEWLASPVRYREDTAAVVQLTALARSATHLPVLAYHYYRLAQQGFDQVIGSGDSARLKSYCYAVRATLALEWLRRRREPPPMDLPSLVAGLALPAKTKASIGSLVQTKSASTERDTTPRIPELDRLIGDVLATPIESADRNPRPTVASEANALFASIVCGKDAGTPSRI